MSLQIKQLTKKFGQHVAVAQLNFEVKSGDIFGLLGRNGAGKSTTIKQILGLIEPTEGDILWKGNKLNPKNITIGYLPEERGLFIKRTIVEQMIYFGMLEGMSQKEAEAALDFWLDYMDITEYKKKLVTELSKGNQQKIQLIAALIHDPELIILDEPFTGLDPVNVEIFVQIIREQAAKGKMIIFSSHQMSIVEALCDEVVLLKHGVAEVAGSLREIKKSYGYKNLILENNEQILAALTARNLQPETVDGKLRLKLESTIEVQEILATLTEAQVEVEDFSFAPPTLQEIFVERIG